MAAYIIYNQLDVTDAEAWAEYGSKIKAQMADFGGRILAAEANAKVLEGEWDGVRNVIAEFPNMEMLERWYSSDEYKPLLKMRLGATRGNLIVVNGV